MTKDEFKIIANVLTSMYIQKDFLSTKETLLLWYDFLKDKEYFLLAKAVKNYINNNQFPPTIADLNEYYYGERNSFEYRVKEAKSKQIFDNIVFINIPKPKCLNWTDDIWESSNDWLLSRIENNILIRDILIKNIKSQSDTYAANKCAEKNIRRTFVGGEYNPEWEKAYNYFYESFKKRYIRFLNNNAEVQEWKNNLYAQIYLGYLKLLNDESQIKTTYNLDKTEYIQSFIKRLVNEVYPRLSEESQKIIESESRKILSQEDVLLLESLKVSEGTNKKVLFGNMFLLE